MAPAIERIAWFWTDLVAPWPLARRRMAVAGLFSALYGMSALIALAYGDFAAFASDPRWVALFLTLTFSAYQLDALPRAIDRLWDSLHPWLIDADRDINALRAATRPTLAGLFPLGVVLWLGMVGLWTATDSWGDRFADPGLARTLNLAIGCTASWYFLSAGGVFHTLGLWGLLRRLARDVDFRPELLLTGSKSALRPFNQLLWQAWRFLLVTVLLATVGTNLPGQQSLRVEEWLLWLVIGIALLYLVSMQQLMNTLLADAKSRTLRRLRAQLDAERAVTDQDEASVLRSLHRVQVITHDIRTAEGFMPTLVDTRFVVQITASVVATLIANVLIRTVITDVVGR